MLEVNFKHKNGHDLGNMFGTENLPEGTHCITIDGQRAVEQHTGFERLIQMLATSNQQQKVSIVYLKNIFSLSPDYLAALIAITKKSDRLSLTDAFLGDPGFACLMSCLMQDPDNTNGGIKDLSIFHCSEPNHIPIVTMPQATMLFSGIAYSPSLEQLTLLRLPFGPHIDEAGRAFIHALRRNRSLKSLEVQMEGTFQDPDMITNILRAAILETKVQTIDYCQREGGAVDLRTLAGLMYRENCSLETLYLHQVALRLPYSLRLPPIEVKNKSLKSLILTDNHLKSSTAVYVAEGCKSLAYLDVSDNHISDLAPFDRMLLGDDGASLKNLVLNSNPAITEKHLMTFIHKLPRMKTLTSIDMKDLAPLKKKSCRDALLEAVWRNTSLECVCCFEESGEEVNEQNREDIEFFQTSLAIPLSLNRGGRGALQNLPSNSIPRGLWALILHRAVTIKYCSGSDYFEYPENTDLRLDVAYWLLRTKFLV